MHYLNMETWPRRDHFRLFSGFNHPHFGLCANVEVTGLRRYLRQQAAPFSVAVVYLIARAANAIPEFRQRIRDGRAVEHERVEPSFTIATGNELFGFCSIGYREEFGAFAADAAVRMEDARLHPTLQNDPTRDDLLFITAMPWVSFTGFVHPMRQHPADSIPRFAFGKIFGDPKLRQMPLGVQGHHAVLDGVHVGKFYSLMEEYLAHPEAVLNGT